VTDEGHSLSKELTLLGALGEEQYNTCVTEGSGSSLYFVPVRGMTRTDLLATLGFLILNPCTLRRSPW
jgi:hypothetical protein